MIEETSDFEIVFGGDRPKYRKASSGADGDNCWLDDISSDNLLKAAASDGVSLFGLFFCGKPVSRSGPHGTSVVRQFRAAKGWLVITENYASEAMRNVRHPFWVPRFIWKRFSKARAVGAASLRAIYFDENLQQQQGTNFYAHWEAKGEVREDDFPVPVELETDIEIVDDQTFHLTVQGVDRFTFRFWESAPKRFQFPRNGRVEYEPPIWRKSWVTIHSPRVNKPA